jgi:hypothetical protein
LLICADPGSESVGGVAWFGVRMVDVVRLLHAGLAGCIGRACFCAVIPADQIGPLELGRRLAAQATRRARRRPRRRRSRSSGGTHECLDVAVYEVHISLRPLAPLANLVGSQRGYGTLQPSCMAWARASSAVSDRGFAGPQRDRMVS